MSNATLTWAKKKPSVWENPDGLHCVNAPTGFLLEVSRTHGDTEQVKYTHPFRWVATRARNRVWWDRYERQSFLTPEAAALDCEAALWELGHLDAAAAAGRWHYEANGFTTGEGDIWCAGQCVAEVHADTTELAAELAKNILHALIAAELRKEITTNG